MRTFLTPTLAAGALAAALLAPRLFGRPAEAAVEPTPSPPPPPVALAGDAPTVQVELDRAAVLAGGTLRAQVTLLAPTSELSVDRAPSDVVLVLDTSGSMSGQKIADARAAATAFLDLLGPEDRVALVAFSSGPQLLQPLAPRTSTTYAHVASLHDAGGTNMDAALRMATGLVAERAPGRARRVVLLSDGHPDDASQLDSLAANLSGLEAPLTTVGIGVDYDPLLMQRLADHGTGNFYWAQSGSELAATFAHEFTATRATVASAVTLDLDPGPHAHLASASGLSVSKGDVVALGSMFSGQRRTFYVDLGVNGASTGQVDLGQITLRWTDARGRLGEQTLALGSVEVTRDVQKVAATLDADTWAASVVQEEYNALRQKVTAAVQAGNQQAAIDELQAYQLRNEQLNVVVGSGAVRDNLAETAALEQQVRNGDLDRGGLVDMATKAYQSRRAGSSVAY